MGPEDFVEGRGDASDARGFIIGHGFTKVCNFGFGYGAFSSTVNFSSAIPSMKCCRLEKLSLHWLWLNKDL